MWRCGRGVMAHPGLLEGKGVSLDDVWRVMGEEHRYVQMFAPDWATQLAVEVHDPVAGDARVWNLDEADDAELQREGTDIASEADAGAIAQEPFGHQMRNSWRIILATALLSEPILNALLARGEKPE